jgi:hypothetical protein
MGCPECKSPQVEALRADPIRTGGQSLWARKCKKCGYVWSEPRPLPSQAAALKVSPLRVIKPVKGVDPAPPVKGVEEPPAPVVVVPVGEPPVGDEPPAGDDGGTVEPCDPDSLQVGELIEYADRKGNLKRASVASQKPGAKSLQVDVPRKPDRRIQKANVKGRVVKV